MNLNIKLCCFGLFVAILGGRQPLFAEEPKLLPPSPSFVTVESVGEYKNGDGEKLLSVTFTREHMAPPPKGKVGEPAPEPKWVRGEYKDVIPLYRLVVTSADGKAIPAKEWDKLAGKVVLMVSGDGPLDPAYAKLLAKDTIVLSTLPKAKK